MSPARRSAIVVSESMAKALWPGKDAMGQCIKVGADTLPCSYVVGIAENIKSQSLSEDPGLFYYLVGRAVRAASRADCSCGWPANQTGAKEAVRRKLQASMPGASYVTVTPFTDVIGGETASWRLGATMFSLFGVLALVLAAIGLYSRDRVQRGAADARTRRARGARARRCGTWCGSCSRDGMRVAAVGVALGAIIALGVSRWVKPLLFQQSALDPVVYWRSGVGVTQRCRAGELDPGAAGGEGGSDGGAYGQSERGRFQVSGVRGGRFQLSGFG